MKYVLPALALVLALVAAPDALPGTGDIHVVTLTRDGRVYVSFTLGGGLSDESREAIHSGLPTTITYDVELRKTVPIWFDTTLAAATVTATVQYDNLTRLHQLSRSVDGRGEPARMTADEHDVQAFMTRFERLPLFTTDHLEANGEYYVKVRARMRPRTSWFIFWPWDRGGIVGTAKFTFIP